MSTENELLDYINSLLEPIDDLMNDINLNVPDNESSKTKSFRSDLAGMLAIAICAIYENCIKEILIYQASLYHSTFENYIRDAYGKLNSKITFDDLNKYSKMFSEKLSDNFKKIIEEKYYTENCRVSQLSAGRIANDIWKYKTLLEFRHGFAHSYKKSETLETVYKYHSTSKHIILAFAEALSQKL